MFKVTFPYDEILRQARAAQGRLEQDKAELLDIVGTQVLSLSQLAYREKARGQRGGDGITWAKLKRSTIKARVLQRAPGQAIVKQRKQLAAQIRALLGTKGQRQRKPPKARRRRSGRPSRRRPQSPVKAIQKRLKTMPKIRGAGTTIAEKVAKLRRKRLELLLKLEQMVDREFAQHEIGVNTGLQRSSATPGYRATDSKGGNLFEKGTDFVTVGYARNYSKFFDEKRSLLPAELPADWQRKIDKTATDWMEKKSRGLFG